MKRYTKPIHVPEVVRHRPVDSSLALINVVFLLLLFLLVAGTLRPPLPEGFDWAQTKSEDGAGNIEGSLVLSKDGEIWLDGKPLGEGDIEAYLADAASEGGRLSVQVDKRARMQAVASLADLLKQNGISQLTLVTVEAGKP